MSTERSGSERIVLLPSGEIGQRLLSLSSEWLNAGVIDSIHWLYPDQLGDANDGDRLIKSLHSWIDPETGQPSVEERDLFQWIALKNPAEVTISALRFIDEPEAKSKATTKSHEIFLEHISTKLPTDAFIQGREVKGIKQRKINILFSPTKDLRNENARAVASPYFGENIFVSQEDRENPGGADAWKPLTSMENYIPFILSNVMSLIGGWAGVSQNILPESLQQGGNPNKVNIRVARSFVRIVQTESFTLRTAAQAAKELVGRENPLVDPFLAAQVQGLEIIPPEKTESVLEKELEWIVSQDNRALTYHAPAPLAELQRSAVGVIGLKLTYWKFAFDKIKILPELLFRSIATLFSQRQKELYLGADSDVEVNVLIDARIRKEDPVLADSIESLNALQERAKAVVAQRPIEVTRVAAPTLWGKLRDGLIALVDGSTGPNGGPVKKSEENKIQVLSDLNKLLPRPGDSWVFSEEAQQIGPSGAAIKRSDVEETTSHMNAITEKITEAVNTEKLLEETRKAEKLRAEELRGQYDQVALRLDALKDSPTVGGNSRSTEELDEARKSLDEIARQLELSKSRFEALDRRAARLAAEKGKLEEEKNSLDSWIQDQQRAFSAQLNHHLTEQELRLQNDENAIIDITSKLSTSHLVKASALQKEFLRNLRNILFFTTLFVVVYYFLIRQLKKTLNVVPFLSTSLWFLILLWIVVFLIALTSILRSYFRKWMRLSNSINKAHNEVNWVINSANHIREERARINGLFPQVKGQLELLAYMIHHPWKIPADLEAQKSVSPDLEHVPNHLQFAIVADEGAGEGATVRRQLLANAIRPGIRRESIQKLLSDIEQRLSLPSNSLTWDAIDVDASPAGPRSFVVKALSTTDVVERAGVRKVREFVRSIQGLMGASIALPPVIQLQKVNAGAGATAGVLDSKKSGMDWDGFLSQAIGDANQISPTNFTEDALQDYKPHATFKSVAIVPPRIVNRASSTVDCVPANVEHGYALELACRIDITEPLPSEALKAFEVKGTSSGSTSTDSAPPPGDIEDDEDDII